MQERVIAGLPGCLKKIKKLMKALSLWQPWASAMALGFKKIETRSWSTKYRGPLLIHAAKKVIQWPNVHIQAMFEDIAFQPDDLPLGQIICRVNLIDCKRILIHNRPYEEMERALGDYTPGRYMWTTNNLQIFPSFPFRGKQGLFDVPWGKEGE